MNIKDEFIRKVDLITSPTLQETCAEVLSNPDFFIFPASLSFHHAYVGGLAAHTLEVWNIAEEIANIKHIHPVNKDILGVGCLFHDFLKIKEYSIANFPIPKQRFLPYQDKFFVKGIGQDAEHTHIIDGAIEFVAIAKKHNVSENFINRIKHIILSHHGPVREWGSPIAPNSLEALIIHQADVLSAHGGISK